jgi:putative ABC transport system substrate-binding protein
MMDRRAVLAGACGLLLAASFDAAAQPRTRVATIGFLAPGPAEAAPKLVEAFRAGLRELGYAEGQSIQIEYRWAEDDGQFPPLAKDLIRSKVDVIVATTVPAIRAAQRATATIPIVMTLSSDPVRMGLVASLARPGRNTTGTASLIQDLAAKRLQLLKESLPRLARATVLFNPTNSAVRAEWALMETAGQTLGVKLRPMEVREPAQVQAALAAIASDRPDALVIVADVLTFRTRREIIDFAASHRLPAMYGIKEFVQAGGLMAYGPSVPELFRRAATYVDRILRGAKPGDLPVEQPTKFDLVINLKTAKMLGLTLPPSLLARADEVIE